MTKLQEFNVFVKQLPPGSPPREGLVWKPQTHRWIRPEAVKKPQKTKVSKYDFSDLSLKKEQEISESDIEYLEEMPYDVLELVEESDLNFAMEAFSGELWDVGKPDRYVVRNEKNQPEGVIYLLITKEKSGKKYVTIHTLATNPKNMRNSTHPEKRRGVGTFFILSIIKEAQKGGISYIELSSRPESIKFYTKVGFTYVDPEDTREQMRLDPTYAPTLILSSEKFSNILRKAGWE